MLADKDPSILATPVPPVISCIPGNMFLFIDLMIFLIANASSILSGYSVQSNEKVLRFTPSKESVACGLIAVPLVAPIDLPNPEEKLFKAFLPMYAAILAAWPATGVCFSVRSFSPNTASNAPFAPASPNAIRSLPISPMPPVNAGANVSAINASKKVLSNPFTCRPVASVNVVGIGSSTANIPVSLALVNSVFN